MPITLNHSNISVQYSSDKSYIIETVKSDLYRSNEIYDSIVRDNIQVAPVTPSIYIENGNNGSNIYAIESYTYSGSANTADFTRVFTKSTTCDILIVGGGGAGGNSIGGGGGAGGVVYTINQTLIAGTYTIGVGKGGIGTILPGGDGQGTVGIDQDGKDSFVQLNSTDVSLSMGGVSQSLRGKGGGGGGVYYSAITGNGRNGGSGGGAAERESAIYNGGSATQGNTLWNGTSYVVGGSSGNGNLTSDGNYYAAGGGGAGNTLFNNSIYNGKTGVQINITGASQFYAAGGGGGQLISNDLTRGLGGSGIGGNGRVWTGSQYIREASKGTDGTGSGGGGGSYDADPDLPAGNGGSGIVIIRYLLGTIPTTNFLTTEPTVSAPAFTESIQSFLHSGGAENQTTHTITVGRDTICDILIVGGGGAGGNSMGGGGGAGGVVYAVNQTLFAGTYTIGVGKGGTGIALLGDQGTAGVNQDGKDSFIQLNGTDVSLPMGSANQSLRGKGGGGGGVYYDAAFVNGRNGGSGGGCSEFNPNFAVNIPGSATQGNTLWNGTSYVAGGKAGRANTTTFNDYNAGGGGGAGNNGASYKDGNAGVQINITGISQFYAAGGGGGQYGVQNSLSEGIGGSGIGGTGRIRGSDSQGYLREATSGTDGTGSGGGGGAYAQDPDLPSGSGGSGIVIIKFKSLVGFGIVLEGNPFITHKRLNFAFDSLGFSFDTTKYIEYQAQQKTGVGGWRIVRYLPPTSTAWYPINDNLIGTTQSGISYSYTNYWTIPFGTFDEFVFGTLNMNYWLHCTKTTAYASYNNTAANIIKSSFSSTPYTALWFNRGSGNPEDPLISIQNYDTQILYGENSSTANPINMIPLDGGMCVLVRDSATSIIIPNMRIYPLNFQVPTLADINNNSNIILRGEYDIALSTSNALIIPKEGQYIPPPTTFINYSVERMYPPVRNFTAATTVVSGQTYGNGTYVVTFSSTYGDIYDPWTCFNTANTTGGLWAINRYTAGVFNNTSFIVAGYLGDWVKIQLPVAINLSRFSFLQRTGFLNRSPKDFKIYGSNDNITWIELVNKTDVVYNASYIYEQSTPEITNTYAYYGLVVNKLFGTETILNFDEWYIYGREVLRSSLSLRYNLLNPILDPIGAQWTYSSNNTNVYHMGRVGICTTSPEYPLDVRGTIYSSTGGYTSSTLTKWSVMSDRRIKENIVKASYDKCLENVKNIELYNFNFKDNCVNTNDRHQLGFIAQEVQQVYPKAVEVGKMIVNLEQKIDDLLTLNITQIDYTLYGAVKSLIEKIENIKIKMEHIKTTYDIP